MTTTSRENTTATTTTAATAAAESTDSPYRRLHIAPLNEDLLGVVLPSAVLPRARNVSYHTLATFPERSYGFVELPDADAERLRRRLNGAVLRGVKIRVETARPDDQPVPLGEAEAMAGDDEVAKHKRRDKRAGGDGDRPRKRKRRTGKEEEIPGVVLEPGRKVKRGWTVSDESKSSRRAEIERRKEKERKKEERKKEKKDRKQARREIRSRYSDHAECLIKTTLPDRSEDPGGEEDGKKRRKRTKEVVIHEFEKTTKFPTFLKAADTPSSKYKPELDFVDGKGWVDQDGNVVEPVKPRPGTVGSTPVLPSRTDAKQKKQGKEKVEDEPEKDSSSDDDDSSSSQSEDDDVQSRGDRMEVDDTTTTPPPLSRTKSTSTPTFPPLKTDQARPKSSGSTTSLTIKIPPATPPVHPLEALYKRARAPDGETSGPTESASQPFRFFGGGDTDIEEEDGDDGNDVVATSPTSQIPMTPFTRRDLESRGVRSAAPTPDTAHPTRTAKFWRRSEEGEDDIEEEDESGEEDGSGSGSGGEDAAGIGSEGADGEQPGAPVSEFQRWFWENRGELNRAWKRRRKTAAKEKRYRDNKARAERAI